MGWIWWCHLHLRCIIEVSPELLIPPIPAVVFLLNNQYVLQLDYYYFYMSPGSIFMYLCTSFWWKLGSLKCRKKVCQTIHTERNLRLGYVAGNCFININISVAVNKSICFVAVYEQYVEGVIFLNIAQSPSKKVLHHVREVVSSWNSVGLDDDVARDIYTLMIWLQTWSWV
jgi:hypothetical protein